MKDLEAAKQILEKRITRDGDMDVLKLSWKEYVKKVLSRFKMDESKLGFVDDGMARDIDGKNGTTGYVYTLAGTAVSWVSKFLKIVSLFTTEAEYIVVTELAKR
ncbi:CCHC-type domain-containing protein [Abeliophyllum distichum]|uniref:CCHC-type domain-containing protein n=1 Tax=Abeliophyllum distichum TaxID=126358 RepID=A0ABD1RXQ4_9LAMI